jgi:diadenosine tetraphosphatase ApaH/serine/threonine PP2A family protein phosphatase
VEIIESEVFYRQRRMLVAAIVIALFSGGYAQLISRQALHFMGAYDGLRSVVSFAIQRKENYSVRTAIISDIHGNLEALNRVLEDIGDQNIDRTVCLGDTLGYGPNPAECVDLVAEHCEWSLLGNHDYGALYEPTNFNAAAEQAAHWTRAQFDAEEDKEVAAKRWEFLGGLRVRTQMEDFLCVHGTPRRPINEYLFPDDAINSPVKMKQIFDRIPKHSMSGHTHVPGIFTDEPDFYPPDELNGSFNFADEEHIIINPGSVGQPRDLDPRLSYAILDDEVCTVDFFRIDYDIDTVCEKIHAIPDLSNWLGDRLREGR